MRSRLFVAGLAVAVAWPSARAAADRPGPSSNSTILPLTPTNFATIPTVPATTTTTVPPAPGEAIAGETTYVIVAGDYPSTIARSSSQLPGPADVERLDAVRRPGDQLPGGRHGDQDPGRGDRSRARPPPRPPPPRRAGGATTTSAAAGTSRTTTTAGSGSSRSTTTTAAASTPTNSAGPCVEGTYTIQKGDIPINVAKKFDLTVDQLNAANANTKGYKSFGIGIKIIIPKGSNCPYPGL